jgi:hypothetical protein
MDPFEHHHSRGLRHMDSHETFVSMMHIDPAPMEYEGEYEGGGEGENGTYYNNNNGTAAGDVAYNGGHDAENGNGASFSQRSRDLSFTAYSEKGSLGGVGSIGISSSGHGSVYYRGWLSLSSPSSSCGRPVAPLGAAVPCCLLSALLRAPLTLAPPPVARIQKYSSYAFTIFTTIHFANTAVIPLLVRSVPASETYLIQAREIYQSPVAEALLVGLPVAVHVASGLALRLVRRSQNIRRYGGDGGRAGSASAPGLVALQGRPTKPADAAAAAAAVAAHHHSAPSVWPALSWISASGYWFLGFVSAHVAMNRILPVLFDGDSSNIGLAYVAHGFARHPAVAHAAYMGLVGAGTAHMVWGAARWWGVAPSTASWWGRESHQVARAEKKRRRRRWMTVNGVVVVIGGVWAAGGLGVIARGGEAPGWIGGLYDGLYSKVWLA